jgi:heme A synthase
VNPRPLRHALRILRITTLLVLIVIATSAFVLLAVQGLLGASHVLIARPLPLAVLHNFGVALLLAALVGRSWPKEKPRS